MNSRKKYFILLFTLALTVNGFSQELLSSIGGYPQLKGSQVSLKTGVGVLELPFIDDFSSTFPYPDPQKWIDSDAYINANLGDNSPGIGVATLDAIDSTGTIYSIADIFGFQADFLTSRPINLDIGGDTTVYLSFFYQPQGLGDAPESGDSLILEFYSKQDSKWHWVWSVAGSDNHEFKQILIPVRGAMYLNDGFQFRFSNKASLADSYEKSLKTNVDHWHLDYIYLDQGRHYQDSVVDDLVIQQKFGSFLLNYSAIPWEHFQQAGINEVASIFPITLKNLSGERKFYEPVFDIQDEYGTTQGFQKTLFADEVQAFQELNYESTFNFGFTSDAADSAKFHIELDLGPTESDLIPSNTILTHDQVFEDYYAYDDGTAEAGYGVTGDGSDNAIIVVKYHNFIPGDSLVGVSIFFNKSFEDSNKKYFQIVVLEDLNGQPGSILFMQDGYRAGFENGLMGFDYFEFDTAQVVADSYFIGIKQVTSDFLNIGFDRNTSHQEDIFYRRLIDWKQTSYEGSLMIRPVFANTSKKTGIVDSPFDQKQIKLNIFPNPVSEELMIDFPAEHANSTIQILNQNGQTVISTQKTTSVVHVDKLAAGSYYLIFQSGSQRISKRFIKL